jgi:hypothetical protein
MNPATVHGWWDLRGSGESSLQGLWQYSMVLVVSNRNDEALASRPIKTASSFNS